MKLKSFNVVEFADDTLIAVHVFDNREEAEDCFRDVAKDNEFTKAQIKLGLKESYLEHSDGDYKLFLSWD